MPVLSLVWKESALFSWLSLSLFLSLWGAKPETSGCDLVFADVTERSQLLLEQTGLLAGQRDSGLDCLMATAASACAVGEVGRWWLSSHCPKTSGLCPGCCLDLCFTLGTVWVEKGVPQGKAHLLHLRLIPASRFHGPALAVGSRSHIRQWKRIHVACLIQMDWNRWKSWDRTVFSLSVLEKGLVSKMLAKY